LPAWQQAHPRPRAGSSYANNMRQPRKPPWRCPAGPHAAKRGVAPPSAPAPSMLKMWPPAGCSRITRIACRRLRARASGCRPPLLYNGGDPAAGGHGWRQQIPATRSARHEALAVGISAARGSLGGAQDRTRTATCAAQPARPGRHAGAHEGAALESPGPPPPPPPPRGGGRPPPLRGLPRAYVLLRGSKRRRPSEAQGVGAFVARRGAAAGV